MKFAGQGKVIFIGAGPGDPGLITVKGLERINTADVIICEDSINPQFLEKIRPGTEVIYLKGQEGPHVLDQEKIDSLMIKRAREGKIIARVTLEDPFSFGYCSYEAEILAEAGVAFEIIPGLSYAAAANAYAGIPLTGLRNNSAVIFISGKDQKAVSACNIDWLTRGPTDPGLVFSDVMEDLSSMIKRLQDNGLSSETPVAVISCGTSSRQRVVTGKLGSMAESVKKTPFLPPVVVTIGEVVNLREKFNWFERKPLFGKVILVTRAREQAGAFSSLLKEYGAEPVEFPTIEIVPPKSWKPVDKALQKLEDFHWLIFTSVNGVSFFVQRLFERDMDIRDLKGLKICAIGPQTATAVQVLGVKVDIVPQEYRAEAIIDALGRENIRGLKFLMPRAEVAREVLPRELRKLGAEILVPAAYRTVKPSEGLKEVKQLLVEKRISMVTFTSSSTVRNFVEMMGENDIMALMEGIKVASIGPITADTAAGYGIASHVMPREYTIPALTKAIIEFFQAEQV